MKNKEFTRNYVIRELEEIISNIESEGLYALDGIRHKVEDLKEGEIKINLLREKYVIDEDSIELPVKKISLINYEGDCLYCIRERGHSEIKIYDQYGELLEKTTNTELLDFIDGNKFITDSRGKKWEWNNEPKEAKASIKEIYNFLSNK